MCDKSHLLFVLGVLGEQSLIISENSISNGSTTIPLSADMSLGFADSFCVNLTGLKKLLRASTEKKFDLKINDDFFYVGDFKFKMISNSFGVVSNMNLDCKDLKTLAAFSSFDTVQIKIKNIKDATLFAANSVQAFKVKLDLFKKNFYLNVQCKSLQYVSIPQDVLQIIGKFLGKNFHCDPTALIIITQEKSKFNVGMWLNSIVDDSLYTSWTFDCSTKATSEIYSELKQQVVSNYVSLDIILYLNWLKTNLKEFLHLRGCADVKTHNVEIEFLESWASYRRSDNRGSWFHRYSNSQQLRNSQIPKIQIQISDLQRIFKILKILGKYEMILSIPSASSPWELKCKNDGQDFSIVTKQYKVE